ncbi:hypothetical protein [Agarivorans sp. QJM3NY_25]|uniref:hypothetical protein n=1 Tax=Agarivorans sp. QJM3NY_25 TaxID=3421430 RepID=UPI003D7D7A5D
MQFMFEEMAKQNKTTRADIRMGIEKASDSGECNQGVIDALKGLEGAVKCQMAFTENCVEQFARGLAEQNHD